jgi:Transglutaminase-like superfamily
LTPTLTGTKPARRSDRGPRVSDLPADLARPLPSGRRVLLGLEILATYGRVRVRLFRHRFPTALAALRDLSGPSGWVSNLSRPNGTARGGGCAGEPASAERSTRELRVTYLRAARLARAVQRTLRFVPVDGRCLMQSLVLTALLARRGIDSKLLIGVNQDDEFEAHAWVEYSGHALLPGSQGTYYVLAQL